MTQAFFEQINYSSSNEDSESELTALRLQPADEVLCITASGARPLDLLTAGPAKIVSVDFNPTQNHLLKLKLAAYQSGDYERLREFLGLTPSQRRGQLYAELRRYLDDQARKFWDAHPRLIARGVLYCGTWEKILHGLSQLGWLRYPAWRRLWHAADLPRQRDEWDQHWTGPPFSWFVQAISWRFLWTHILREPGASLIPREMNVAAYLTESLHQLAHRMLLRENPFANLLFHGRYMPSCELPRHLRPEYFDVIRAHVNALEIHTAPLDEYLAASPARFTAFSLSDFSSYAPPAAYARIWANIYHAARPGARFCERFFLVKPAALSAEPQTAPWRQASRDLALENRLAETDHTCLYTFHAGTLGATNGAS